MKILYLLPAVSHPTMRGELRHYHFLGALARRHEVSLVALTRTPVTADALAQLRAITRHVQIIDATQPAGEVTTDRGAAGMSALRQRQAKRRRLGQAIQLMREQVRQLVRSERFDVVVVYGAMLQPVMKGLDRLPIVADLCDAESMRLRQSLRFVNPIEGAWRFVSWWWTREAERWLVRHARHVTFISGRDLIAVPSAAGRARIVPNGLDADYWSRSAPPAMEHSLVFTGVMDYAPNADAGEYLARQILPRVRLALPDTRLTIAGRDPTEKLRQMAARTGAVVITDYVADLRPHLEQAAVFVAPLRFASGTQNKILEAMSMELPVVTSAVAADGLRVEGAEDPPVLVADQPDAFAATVIQLLGDARRRRRLGALGRAYVRRHFDWERSAVLLEATCLGAATGSSVAAPFAPGAASGLPAPLTPKAAQEEKADARRLTAHG